ncbi:hypothetical protein C8A00DRAFT_29958 [Chaetomidium leptoderma]|uniref:Uncharacterized protein n=1 Tax=Chaetomidium leptoderma TaxID=669021 RepID=A0AAN7A020_9PEZI|nr:hypothetical protein C8A00DRAFT_29958 [Chaetomidium leptoderma]
MSSQPPSTPVKVPSSAANYTAATLDPDLRSQINSILIKENQVTKIQDSLLHALHSHQNNWPTLIQTHALSLLRSGEVTSFPALLRRVMEDVRQDTALAPNSTSNSSNGTTTKSAAAVNGTSEENGSSATVNGKKSDGTTNGTTTNNNNNGTTTTSAGSRPSLAIPQTVVDEALKVTRDCLDAVCEMDDSGAT